MSFSNKQDNTLIKSSTDQHNCIDPDHTSCDGLCKCDGYECDASVYNDAIDEIVSNATELQHNHPKVINKMKDYQLEVTGGEKFILYDGNKVVHVFDRAFPGNNNLFRVIDRDNW
jgi:hypothetical protein